MSLDHIRTSIAPTTALSHGNNTKGAIASSTALDMSTLSSAAIFMMSQLCARQKMHCIAAAVLATRA